MCEDLTSPGVDDLYIYIYIYKYIYNVILIYLLRLVLNANLLDSVDEPFLDVHEKYCYFPRTFFDYSFDQLKKNAIVWFKPTRMNLKRVWVEITVCTRDISNQTCSQPLQ